MHKTPLILVVEDEPSISDNVEFVLNREGMKTLCCVTGKEAQKILEQNSIDLIILDVGLPDISGFDLCREIRKKYSLPILFLTARSDEIDRVVGLEIGADDYLTKPFSPRELAARVKAVLRRTQTQNSTPPSTPLLQKEVCGFWVDEERCRITCFGKPLELTRYEFRILKVLIQRPGHVLSRDQLMDLAWDAPDSSLDRTVDAHVKSIRSKLKKCRAGFDPIVTHRGMGYSLREK